MRAKQREEAEAVIEKLLQDDGVQFRIMSRDKAIKFLLKEKCYEGLVKYSDSKKITPYTLNLILTLSVVANMYN